MRKHFSLRWREGEFFDIQPQVASCSAVGPILSPAVGERVGRIEPATDNLPLTTALWWKHHATGVPAKRRCCASWGEFSVVTQDPNEIAASARVLPVTSNLLPSRCPILSLAVGDRVEDRTDN